MWQLHSGNHEWIACLVNQPGTAAVAEFDVQDCFMNTPRDEVPQAVDFRLEALPRRTRGKLYFSMSKDSKAADRMGPHFLLTIGKSQLLCLLLLWAGSSR